MKSVAFARSRAIFAAIAAAMALGGTAARDALSIIPTYRSRGKGKGRGKARAWHSRGVTYPFSSDRQHKRHAARQYTVTTRGGFEIMQTRRAERA